MDNIVTLSVQALCSAHGGSVFRPLRLMTRCLTHRSRLRPWNHCQRHFVNFRTVPEYVRCCCCFRGCSNSVKNERPKASPGSTSAMSMRECLVASESNLKTRGTASKIDGLRSALRY
ncbi:hypothetical protein LZ31DRAFT_232504 [Colletotrichum somersetense]|nr:hypothetical protein LZ31DRAFT_232504 [Colletotrichum somersetense]